MAGCPGPARLGQRQSHISAGPGDTSHGPAPRAGPALLWATSRSAQTAASLGASHPGQRWATCITGWRKEGGLDWDVSRRGSGNEEVVGLRRWEGHLPTCFWPLPGTGLPGR